MIKHSAKKLFRSLGLELRRLPAQGAGAKAGEPERGSLRGALRQMIKLGIRPRTVIDVGVAFETRELYEEIPAAEFLLVEPLADFEPFLKKICSKYNAQYVLAAAGDAAGSATLNVHTDQLYCSSLLRETEGETVDGVPRTVPMVTIDALCHERGLEGPYLMKIDVQGAELLVLNGATKTLKECEGVILEVTLFGTMIGGPQFADVVSYMQERGFAVYDVWGMLYRPLDGALAQMDMAFVRKDSALRANHAFATPAQRKKLAWNLEDKTLVE